MRQHHMCPKCDCTDLWVVEPVRQPSHKYGNAVETMTVTAGLVGGPIASRINVGTFAAWICSGCGYTEWYAKGYQQLASLAHDPKHGVRMVRGGAAPQGYR